MFLSQLLSIPLTNEEDFTKKLNTIKYIALFNGVSNTFVDNLHKA